MKRIHHIFLRKMLLHARENWYNIAKDMGALMHQA